MYKREYLLTPKHYSVCRIVAENQAYGIEIFQSLVLVEQYGCQVWGTSFPKEMWKFFEKIQKRFLIEESRAKVQTSYLILLAQTGMIPLEGEALCVMISYLIRLGQIDGRRISQGDKSWFQEAHNQRKTWNISITKYREKKGNFHGSARRPRSSRLSGSRLPPSTQNCIAIFSVQLHLAIFRCFPFYFTLTTCHEPDTIAHLAFCCIAFQSYFQISINDPALPPDSVPASILPISFVKFPPFFLTIADGNFCMLISNTDSEHPNS